MVLRRNKISLADRVVEYVLNYPLDDFPDLTVTRIASAFRVNRCYLSRAFKKDKDFTLCEFLMREKLTRSVALLRADNGLTIRQLSGMMGFSNPNYFIRVFKGYYGAPPGKYREYITKNQPLPPAVPRQKSGTG